MEWVERLNRSLKYIEEHLTDEIDYEKLARTAGCTRQFLIINFVRKMFLYVFQGSV